MTCHPEVASATEGSAVVLRDLNSPRALGAQPRRAFVLAPRWERTNLTSDHEVEFSRHHVWAVITQTAREAELMKTNCGTTWSFGSPPSLRLFLLHTSLWQPSVDFWFASTSLPTLDGRSVSIPPWRFIPLSRCVLPVGLDCWWNYSRKGLDHYLSSLQSRITGSAQRFG